MQIVATIFPVLVLASTISSVVALFFLQSRAKGPARLLLISGAVLSLVLPVSVSLIAGHERAAVHGIIAAAGVNLGIISISAGVILFCLNLPSRRLDLTPDDRRTVSDQVLEDLGRCRGGGPSAMHRMPDGVPGQRSACLPAGASAAE